MNLPGPGATLMPARTRDSLARPLARSASAHNQPGQLWVTKKQMDMEPRDENDKNTPSQMDLAPWCYKWMGWDWISGWGEVRNT